jgi:hypothetical protein
VPFGPEGSMRSRLRSGRSGQIVTRDDLPPEGGRVLAQASRLSARRGRSRSRDRGREAIGSEGREAFAVEVQ